MKKSLSLLFCLVFMAFAPLSVTQAASPSGEFGWTAWASDIIGDDLSCGAGLVKYELVVRNVEDNSLIEPFAALLRSRDLDGGATYDQASAGSSSTVGPICFNPDEHALVIGINGSSDFYDFFSATFAENPSSIPRGKFMRATVWLAPTSKSISEYQNKAPLNSPIVNADPLLKINLGGFPVTYGATGLSRVELFTSGPTEIIDKSIPLSGGVGIKTLPAQSLQDGYYYWAYYLSLNGSRNLGSFTSTKLLKSGFSGYNMNSSFILDREAPDFGAGVSHTPANPYATDLVTITANASDGLSGITQIKVYLDGALIKTCPYSYVNSASCIATTGPFLPSTIHSYYAVATDGAGNDATSPTQNFTVGAGGDCGPADGVQASTPPSGVANLCTIGIPSSDPAVYNGVTNAYEWICSGPDGLPASLDDMACSAPKAESFKLCLTSCSSGSADFNGATITLGPNETRDLRLCRNTSSACDIAGGDLTGDAATVFTDTNSPNDAVAMTAAKGQVRANASASGVNEIVSVSHSSAPATSVTFSVPNICVEDCSNASNVCQGETFDDANNCGANNCDGTRYCDFNWKEVTPGQ